MKRNIIQQQIENRIINEAEYIINNNATIRETARQFGVSKSTVHKDMIIRLNEISMIKAEKVKNVLNINLNERHVRGGESTKRKYCA